MTLTLPESALARASEIVEAKLGLHFPPARWSELEHGLAAAAREAGFKDEAAFMEFLAGRELTPAETEALASHLTVGETYFFRERAVFQALEQHVLPGLIRARSGREQRLRLWSAGCCTGEEPYSLAILLERLLPAAETWSVSILATDINAKFLRRASDAVYREWSFRKVPDEVKSRYFQRLPDGSYQLRSRLRRRVRFQRLNLAEDAYPSPLNDTLAMDLILCRNVLMYFSAARMHEVAARLQRCLAEGGWLVVSSTEMSSVLFQPLRAVRFENAILYRKESHPPQAAPPASAPGLAKARLQPLADAAARPGIASEEESRLATREASSPLDRAAELYRTGACEEAETLLAELLSRDTTHAGAWLLRARICADLGRLQAALTWCEKAIGVDKLNAACYQLQANVLEEMGKLPEAREALKRALYLEPEFPMAHFALGHLCRRLGNQREAARHFRSALSLVALRPRDEELSGSGGLTAGRLAEMIRSATKHDGFTRENRR